MVPTEVHLVPLITFFNHTLEEKFLYEHTAQFTTTRRPVPQTLTRQYWLSLFDPSRHTHKDRYKYKQAKSNIQTEMVPEVDSESKSRSTSECSTKTQPDEAVSTLT